jgi:hypothetical protein
MTEQSPDFSKGIKKGMGIRNSVSSMLDAGRNNLKGTYNFISKFWPEMFLTGVAGALGATFLLSESDMGGELSRVDNPINMAGDVDPDLLPEIDAARLELETYLGPLYEFSIIPEMYNALMEGDMDPDGDGYDYIKELAMTDRNPFYNEEDYEEFVKSQYSSLNNAEVEQNVLESIIANMDHDLNGNRVPTLAEFLLKRDDKGLLVDSDGGLPDVVEYLLEMDPYDSNDNYRYTIDEIEYQGSNGFKKGLFILNQSTILENLNSELDQELHRIGSEDLTITKEEIEEFKDKYLSRRLDEISKGSVLRYVRKGEE